MYTIESANGDYGFFIGMKGLDGIENLQQRQF
jgi:hypothetical protein